MRFWRLLNPFVFCHFSYPYLAALSLRVLDLSGNRDHHLSHLMQNMWSLSACIVWPGNLLSASLPTGSPRGWSAHDKHFQAKLRHLRSLFGSTGALSESTFMVGNNLGVESAGGRSTKNRAKFHRESASHHYQMK